MRGRSRHIRGRSTRHNVQKLVITFQKLVIMIISGICQRYIRDISWIYQGYIRGQREGDPERINRNSLAAMMGQGPLGNGIVLLLCCVSAASPAALARWDLMNRTWEEKRGGGRSPRGRIEGVSPSNSGRVPVPPGPAGWRQKVIIFEQKSLLSIRNHYFQIKIFISN